MAISRKRVKLVNVDDPITSSQLLALVEECQNIQRQGLGDPNWRVHRWWMGLLRSVRNPDSSFNLVPPEAEFLTTYQALRPEDASWPVSGPGEPEGANLDNPLMAYVYGSEWADLYAEDERLTDPYFGGIPLDLGMEGPAATVRQIWRLGKLQRGACDPDAGQIASPAFAAATSFYRITYSLYSKVGNSYGGMVPTPEVLGDCGDGTADLPPTINFQIFFTPLKEGLSVKTYPGTCPDQVGHVLGISRAPWAYYIWLNSGDPASPNLDILPTKDWLEGPYSGGNKVLHQDGGHFSRVLAVHANEYRGSDTQRSAPTYNLENAFLNQEFFESQYLLAPSIGASNGNSIVETYPLFRFSGSARIQRGAYAANVLEGGTRHAYRESFLCTSFLVAGSKLTWKPCKIEVCDGDQVISTVEVSSDSAGDFAKIVMLPEPVRFASLRVRATDELAFQDSTGSLDFEFTEILEYKPELHDQACLLRVAGATDSGATDGRGIDEEGAREVAENYFTYGCIMNAHGEPGLPGTWSSGVNTNGVVDAVRRFSKHIRRIPRQNCVGYAVENSKSILWFTRYAYGMHSATPLDLFEGIAPGRLRVESGAIRWGRTYTVRAGSVFYDGVMVSTGKVFTGKRGLTEFTGDGEVYEYEGIREVAEPQGWSNQWLMDVDFMHYHPSESSIWKPAAYADRYWFSQRCHFMSDELYSKTDLRWHFNYGAPLSRTPEAPSGWNYKSGTNKHPYADPALQLRHNKSCRIYEPPAEMESATVSIEGGQEVIKIVFKTRLFNTSLETGGAPSSIARDTATWSDDIHTEATRLYRTWENGLREYLWLQATGENCGRGAPGDSAFESSVWSDPDDPFGACFPIIQLTQMVPKPYVGDNLKIDIQDSPLLHEIFTQIELYLRCWCEGFMDGMTTALHGCKRLAANDCNVDEYSVFTYTWENCCFDAFGGRWVNLVSSTVRPDLPQGHGPIPNTVCYAEAYNRFAAVLNKLDKAPVWLPLQVETNTYVWSTDTPASIYDSDYTAGPDCSTVSSVHGFWEGTPPEASNLISSTGWVVDGAIYARRSAGIAADRCVGAGWALNSFRETVEYRVTPADPDSLYSIPESWRDMFPDQIGCLACLVQSTSTTKKTSVSDSSASACGAETNFYPIGGGQYWRFDTTTTQVAWCALVTSGRIEAPALGWQVFGVGRTAGGDSCFGVVQNTYLINPHVSESAFVQIPLED